MDGAKLIEGFAYTFITPYPKASEFPWSIHVLDWCVCFFLAYVQSTLVRVRASPCQASRHFVQRFSLTQVHACRGVAMSSLGQLVGVDDMRSRCAVLPKTLIPLALYCATKPHFLNDNQPDAKTGQTS